MDRFWSNVDIKGPDDCWEWTGTTTSGYGKLSFNWINKGRKAHRYSYWLHYGEFDFSKEVCHDPYVCDNKKCVNPKHLRIDTHAGNMKDKIITGASKKNHHCKNKTHCPQGHEYNKENTHISKTGSRQCRVCGKIRARQKRKLRKSNV